MERARDPVGLSGSVAMLAARGEKFDKNDHTILSYRSAGMLPPPIEPRRGLVREVSIGVAPPLVEVLVKGQSISTASCVPYCEFHEVDAWETAL